MSVNIVVPAMGESVMDARIGKWLKHEGDAVTAGEPLVELETDKVNLEVPAPQTGVLARIAHTEGDDVKIGDVLGTIEAGLGSMSPSGSPSPSPNPTTSASSVPAIPSARGLAPEDTVALTSPTPPGPRVAEGDVAKSGTPENTARPGSPRPVKRETPVGPARPGEPNGPVTPGQPVERIRLSTRRATIARRLVEAQHTAAMLTTFNEVEMSAVMALREREKQAFKAAHGVGLGIASFFVKAAVTALREFPHLNAEIQGDEMVLKRYYDIGIAVDAAEGLVVPVLRGADRMTFAEIELGIRAMAHKAQEGALTLDDIRGGTFTITNGGTFGSLMSTPILNPPQVGILGLHAIKDRPIGVGGQVVLRPMMYTALTYDHRIVDGAEAVKFLVRIRELVEDPGVLLLEG